MENELSSIIQVEMQGINIAFEIASKTAGIAAQAFVIFFLWRFFNETISEDEAIILTPSEESENSVTFKVPANVFDIEKYRNDRRMETLVQITGYRDGNSKTVTLPVLIAYNYVDYIHKTFRRVILG